MLFEKRFWAGITDGSITSTFRGGSARRCWRQRYRTPGGLVDVQSIVVVAASEINDDDASRSGMPRLATSSPTCAAPDLPIYRIRVPTCRRSRSRDELARDDLLSEHDLHIRLRLERMDRLSAAGPWTMATLRAIAKHPGVRAADLATCVESRPGASSSTSANSRTSVSRSASRSATGCHRGVRPTCGVLGRRRFPIAERLRVLPANQERSAQSWHW